MYKLVWLGVFTLGLPSLLVICLMAYKASMPDKMISTPRVLGVQTASDPADILSEISANVSTADARELIISQYLKRYNSPLLPFAADVVSASDKYHLDYRLLVAIAQQESNLCKRIPENSYNCWGFGIYGDKVTRFSNYPEGLNIVAKTLKSQYIDKGLDTPEEIMRKYTPPSIELGGPWAKGVNQFLSELE